MLTHKPRKGSFVKWPNSEPCEVTRCEGNLCYIKRAGQSDHDATPFIWRFKDTLNVLAEHCDKDGAALPIKTQAFDDRVHALRDEAAEAGDLRMVEICDRALDPRDNLDTEEAREECIRVMHAAEAQSDG